MESLTQIITDLCQQYPWMAQRYEKIIGLYGECRNDEQIQLTTDLLSKFFYVDESIRNDLYQKIAHYIVNCYDDKTVISAMTVGSAPDSAGSVVNELKTVLYFHGLKNIRQVTRLDDITRASRKRKYPACTKVILVDEFCGSGQTIANRINLLRTRRPDVTEIHVCIMAGMHYAFRNLCQEFPEIGIYFAHTLKRGILDHHTGDSLIGNTIAMLHMENQLASGINQKYLEDFSMGYGNAQALIAFSGCRNIPNSVFPWFWWPLSKDLTKRNNLFIRYEDGL